MYLRFARHPPVKRPDMMLERWRAARRGTGHWLLVRPPVQGSGEWQWCRQPLDVSGAWPPPADALQDTVALIIPAAACSHFQVPAPPGLKRHEWPMLLEEVLQQPADQVQVSCLARTAGHMELLAMERARINGWLTDCEAQDISPVRLWAEQQLLPPQPAGQLLHWHRSADSCLIKGGDNGAQHWLTWPPVLGELPDGWQPPSDEMSGEWPAQWAPLDRLPNLLENARGRRVKTSRRPALFSRTQRRLAGLCTGLALCWGAVLAVQFWQQLPGWKSQVEVVTGPVTNVQQATRALARLQAQQTDWRSRQQQVAELEMAVSDWLASQQGWGVSGITFDGRSWRLVLNGSVQAPALSHWQAMGKAVGAVASVEPDDKASLLTVHFDLGAQP